MNPEEEAQELMKKLVASENDVPEPIVSATKAATWAYSYAITNGVSPENAIKMAGDTFHATLQYVMLSAKLMGGSPLVA